MAEGAGNYQVGVLGAVKKAQWVLAECQWQGGSKQDCSEPVKSVKVRIPFPAQLDVYVHVCDTHYPAYIAAARKDNILV